MQAIIDFKLNLLLKGEALIAYVILMTVVGLPLFVMELALGQLARSGIVKLWRAVPLLKGSARLVFLLKSILT